MQDVTDLRPIIGHDTAETLADALATLAWERQLDRRRDPAARLHLLASLRDQLRSDLLDTVIVAHNHGYTPTQLAVLLDLPLV